MGRRRLLTTGLLFIAVMGNAQTIAIPHLEKSGKAIQLIVQGKPFLALAGELHNSSTSTATYMRDIWKKMAEKNLNTVIILTWSTACSQGQENKTCTWYCCGLDPGKTGIPHILRPGSKRIP
jgi:hypothetical protein